MSRHLSLAVLMLCGVLGSLAGPAFPRNEEAFQRAKAAYDRQDYTTALRELRPLAQRGDATAQTALGVMYAEGQGVTKNYAEAVKWFRKAAAQGNADGQHNLGVTYEHGRGVRQDLAEAVQWYRKAADQGVAAAQNNLGVMYAEGRGVAKDDVEAVRLFQQVAAQGEAAGQGRLGLMYAEGRGVAKDEAEALRLLQQAATQGYPMGQYGLGLMYERGSGVPRNLDEAQRLFTQATDTAGYTSDRMKAQEARDRVARQLAMAQTPTPVPSKPSTPAVTPAVQTQPRRALVIGNTNYPQSPLRNPGNDATAMARFLATEAGFTVYQGRALLDVDRHTFVNAISDFADAIRRDDIVMFYFSGHGLERQGHNYLIPINFAAKNAAQLPYEAPTAQDIQKHLLAGEPSMLIMMLDACRDLPEEFKSLRGRAGGRGLGFMSAVAGATAQQVIMFATAPGTVASDGGTLGNGTFTHCFLRSFQHPGLDSRIAFGDVVQCVLENTNREQSPFLVTSQRQKFVFK